MRCQCVIFFKVFFAKSVDILSELCYTIDS
nr:MAG TPA: hypothetical protein [Caudoviricetes sp.]